MESLVYAFHGIIDESINDSLFTHKNIVNKNDFIDFLNAQKNIKSLDEVLKNGGTAVTIDDSTFASYDAATTAVEMGYPVTIFINPHNIISKENYWFHYLSSSIDNTKLTIIEFDRKFNFSDLQAKNDFREYAKQKFRRSSSIDEVEKCFQLILSLLKVEEKYVPKWLMPMSFDDVMVMKMKGVNIQNHLWTHLDATYVPQEELIKSISMTWDWIQNFMEGIPKYLATPFGSMLPDYNFGHENFNICMLLDYRYYPGFIGKRYFNRVNVNDKKIKLMMKTLHLT